MISSGSSQINSSVLAQEVNENLEELKIDSSI